MTSFGLGLAFLAGLLATIVMPFGAGFFAASAVCAPGDMALDGLPGAATAPFAADFEVALPAGRPAPCAFLGVCRCDDAFLAVFPLFGFRLLGLPTPEGILPCLTTAPPRLGRQYGGHSARFTNGKRR